MPLHLFGCSFSLDTSYEKCFCKHWKTEVMECTYQSLKLRVYIIKYTCFSLPIHCPILIRPLSPTTQYHPSNLHIIPRCRVRDWTLSKDICINWSFPQLSLLPFTMKSSLSACERPIRHASNICLRNKAGGSLLQFCCFKEKGAETASSWWMGLKMLTTQLQRLHFKSTQGLKVAIKLLHTALTCKNTFISNSSVLDLHQAKWWLLFFLGLFLCEFDCNFWSTCTSPTHLSH